MATIDKIISHAEFSNAYRITIVCSLYILLSAFQNYFGNKINAAKFS